MIKRFNYRLSFVTMMGVRYAWGNEVLRFPTILAKLGKRDNDIHSIKK